MAGLNPTNHEPVLFILFGEVSGDTMAAEIISHPLRRNFGTSLPAVSPVFGLEKHGSLIQAASSSTNLRQGPRCTHRNLFYHQYDLSQSHEPTRYCGVINGKIHSDGLLEFRSSKLSGLVDGSTD